MIVMKFGGTSVGGAEQIRNVAEIIKSRQDKKPVIVVSAVKGVTDKLIELGNAASEDKAENILKEIKTIHFGILDGIALDKLLLQKDFQELAYLSEEAVKLGNADARILDSFQSFGERMSSKIVAGCLIKMGIKAEAFNSWELGLLTNNEFGNAEPLADSFYNLNENISKLNSVPVITGFIGKTKDGEITTLGRGGSDYTAGIIGAAINADEIQIWTDVDGIMSADPKIAANARTLDTVSFEEASELAYFGARILHPKTIFPAIRENIPVRVLNTFKPYGHGTSILGNAGKNDHVVKSITCKKGIALINVNSKRMLGAYGFLARLFRVFERYRKSVDVIATTEVSVSVTIDNDSNIDLITQEIISIADVKVAKNKAIICVVGEGMKRTSGIAGKIFSVLGNNNINVEVISQGSDINITFIVDGKDADKAVKMLHEEFYGNNKK